jgi:hypothetical protein
VQRRGGFGRPAVYFVDVSRTVALLVGTLVVAGCSVGSGDPPEDRTPALIRCFEQHGGDRVTRLSQLDRFPSTDPQYGTGFALDSIAFDSIDVVAGAGDVRQSLVLVVRPGLEDAGTRSHSAAVGLRRVRQGEVDVVAMLVMPASVDWDGSLNDCAEAVARDQIFP